MRQLRWRKGPLHSGSRRAPPSVNPVNLAGHDEVVLVQSLDLLGLQRDRRIAPTETDVRMMAFGFCEFAHLLNKGERLPEIAKAESSLDEAAFLCESPAWDLSVKRFGLFAREWRYSPTTGRTGFAGKSFGHVTPFLCQPSPPRGAE